MATFTDTIGQVLTRGIDAAQSVLTTKFTVSNPNPNSSSPGGVPVTAGQGAGMQAVAANAMPLLLVGGVVLVAVLLLRRK